ncbi:DNA helicase [Tanacetum coccineum]
MMNTRNPTTQELQQKAIVCPRNDTADSINSQILKQVAGESTIYRSLDEAIPLKNDAEGNAIQANIGKADIRYFSSLLHDGSTYRISKFTCVPTSNYQQNLWKMKQHKGLEDPSQEKERNKFPLSTLLQQNPDSYKHECSELVKKYNNPDPRDFPPEILSLIGHQHIFQFHYNPYCEMGIIDFYFDDILDKPLQIPERTMPSTSRETG